MSGMSVCVLALLWNQTPVLGQSCRDQSRMVTSHTAPDLVSARERALVHETAHTLQLNASDGACGGRVDVLILNVGLNNMIAAAKSKVAVVQTNYFANARLMAAPSITRVIAMGSTIGQLSHPLNKSVSASIKVRTV